MTGFDLDREAALPEPAPRTWRRSWKTWLAGGVVLLVVAAACTDQDDRAIAGTTVADSATAPAAAGAAPGQPSQPSQPGQPGQPGQPVRPFAGTAPATAGSPSSAGQPVVRVVNVRQRIPFSKRVIKDSSLAKGTTRVVTQGRSGSRIRTYRYTYLDRELVSRELLSTTVTRAPVTQVTRLGTKVARAPEPDPAPEPGRGCDPNYSGCVPIASDVDCAGGSGNGPAYVEGPVRVIGSDIYDLDSDSDGIGCE